MRLNRRLLGLMLKPDRYAINRGLGSEKERCAIVGVDEISRISATSRLSADLTEDTRLVLADLDGCLISEGRPFSDTKGFVEACGDRLWIISNNSSHTAKVLSEELAAIGLQVPADRIMLAGEQTLIHLHDRTPSASIALYASACLQQQASRFGLRVNAPDPEYVVLCRDLEFSIPHMEAVIGHCRRGAQLWVSNIDNSHPAADGLPVPETGALLAALSAVMGEVTFECIGKPHANMAYMVLQRTGCTPEDAVFLGDNTETDGAIAQAMGIRFVHVVREGAA